jgi:hypothetical protein
LTSLDESLAEVHEEMAERGEELRVVVVVVVVVAVEGE